MFETPLIPIVDPDSNRNGFVRTLADLAYRLQDPRTVTTAHSLEQANGLANGIIATVLKPVVCSSVSTGDTDPVRTSLKIIPRSVEVSTLKMLYVYGMMAKPVCAYCKKKYDGWNVDNVTGEELAKHLKEDGWIGICEPGYFNPNEQGIPSGIFLTCPECARQKQEGCVAGGTLLAIWRL